MMSAAGLQLSYCRMEMHALDIIRYQSLGIIDTLNIFYTGFLHINHYFPEGGNVPVPNQQLGDPENADTPN